MAKRARRACFDRSQVWKLIIPHQERFCLLCRIQRVPYRCAVPDVRLAKNCRTREPCRMADLTSLDNQLCVGWTSCLPSRFGYPIDSLKALLRVLGACHERDG